MPTYRQKLTAAKVVENGGNISKAMIAVGYSPNTAKTPGKLTKSKGWKQLMDTAFPDELLIKTHVELLNAQKLVIDHSNGEAEIIAKQKDNSVVIKALDLAYKLKGYYNRKHTNDSHPTKVIITRYN